MHQPSVLNHTAYITMAEQNDRRNLHPDQPVSPDRTGGTVQHAKGDAQTMLGACAVDVATGHILLGQWCAPVFSCSTAMPSALVNGSTVKNSHPCPSRLHALHRLCRAPVQIFQQGGTAGLSSERLCRVEATWCACAS